MEIRPVDREQSSADGTRELEGKLRFARAATARQRRKADDARWLIRQIMAAFDEDDIARARWLVANHGDILAQRRAQHEALGSAAPQ